MAKSVEEMNAIKVQLEKLQTELKLWNEMEEIAKEHNNRLRKHKMEPLRVKSHPKKSWHPRALVNAALKTFHKTNDLDAVLLENRKLEAKNDGYRADIDFEINAIEKLLALFHFEKEELENEEKFWIEQKDANKNLTAETDELAKMLEELI